MARLGHLVLLAAIAPLFVACTQSHAVGLEIVGAPADGSARSFTIRVYRGSRCPSVDDVARDADGALERVYAQTVAAGAALPPVGRLDAGAYAFAALARDSSCRVIAYGCVVADPSEAGSVRVALAAVAADPASPTCAPGVACRDGLCDGAVECDPTACAGTGMAGTCCGTACTDLESDPAHCGRCDIACEPGTTCDRGTCSATSACGAAGCGDVASTCCSGRCVDLQTDSAACGACDRRCTADTVCVGGSCRPSAPPASVRVRLPATPAPDCGPLLLVLVWIPRDASSGAGPALGPVVATDGTAGMPGEVSFPLADLRPPSESLRCGASTDCTTTSIALGQIWLVTDANRDGSVSAAELRGVSLVGVADVGIVWSSTSFSPDDAQLATLLMGTRIGFPEGLLAGPAAYRRGTAGGEAWAFAGAADSFEAATCTSPMCDAPVDDTCRAALPHPFGYLP